jgi:hypothetical protein
MNDFLSDEINFTTDNFATEEIYKSDTSSVYIFLWWCLSQTNTVNI